MPENGREYLAFKKQATTTNKPQKAGKHYKQVTRTIKHLQLRIHYQKLPETIENYNKLQKTTTTMKH